MANMPQKPVKAPVGSRTAPKKKMKKGSKAAVIVLSCVLAVLVAAVGIMSWVVFGKLSGINHDSFNPSDVPVSSGDYIPSDAANAVAPPTTDFDQYGIASDPNIQNIMLIGSDSRTKNPLNGRSDSAMLISIDKNKKRVLMTSFMRDMFVPIPGHGQNRINAAYAWGGPALYLRTVQQDFRVKVEKYVVVGFGGFEKVIDDVGGVDITLTAAEAQQVNANSGSAKVAAGKHRLNGPQALAYARIRHLAGSDFARTQRQRNVMMGVLSKFQKLNLAQMNTTLNDLMPNLNTNLSNSELMSLLSGGLGYRDYPVTELRIPIDKGWSSMTVSGMDVLKVDFDANIQYLQKTIYGVTADGSSGG